MACDGLRLSGREHDPTRILQNVPSWILRNLRCRDFDPALSKKASPIQDGAGISRSLLTGCQKCIGLLLRKVGVLRRVRQFAEEFGGARQAGATKSILKPRHEIRSALIRN